MPPKKHVHIHACAHTRMHIPTDTHCTQICMHMNTRAYPHHAYTCTHTHMQAYMQIHTHTHARVQNWWAENVCCQMSSLYSRAPCPLPGQKKKKGSNPDLPKKMELGEGAEKEGMVAHPVFSALRRLMEAMGSPVTDQPGLQSWTLPQINNKTTKYLMFQTVANQELERHDSWADLTWAQ